MEVDMDFKQLHKTQTGIASEFFVAAELARRGYNVTLTLGNTKSIDLLVEKETKLVPIQVKGIQRSKSITWNIKKDSISDSIIYVFVNLHADTLQSPEFFVLTGSELRQIVKPVSSGRDYIDYSVMKKLNFKDCWNKI